MTIHDVHARQMEALVSDFLRVREAEAYIAAEKAAIKARLLEIAGDCGQWLVGEVQVSVTRPHRVDANLLAAVAPPAQYPHLWRMVPDTEAVRSGDPAILEATLREGDLQVRVQ